MRISRLHILLGLVAVGVVGFVAYKQKEMALKSEPAAMPKREAATPETSPPAEAPAPTTAPSVATTPKPPTAPAPAAASEAAEQYTTLKGDTLWAIARDYSPCRAGAAWVGIWKANKKIIRDFDRLEAGLALMIPKTRKAYVTAFWKPKRFVVASLPIVDLAEVFRHVAAVDLAELPIPWSDLQVEVAELPKPEGSLEYDFAVTAFRAPAPSPVSYR